MKDLHPEVKISLLHHYLFIWITLMEFSLRSTAKAMERRKINWGSKTLHAHDLSILDDNFSKMNEAKEVLRVQGARRGLKINIKKTKSLRLGVSEW